MKNRNLLLFVVLSVAMTAGYTLLMNRLYPAKAVPAAATPTPAPAAPPNTPVAVTASAPTSTAPASTVPAEAFHTVSLAQLRLRFRVADGALVQAEWLADGTKFFPERNDAKQIGDFPGLGGTLDATFDKVVDEAFPGGTAVHFQNAGGDLLTYRIPDRGHVLDVSFSTPRKAALGLVRLPKDMPPVARLGRVYTLQGKAISAVNWTDILTDPFLSSLGRKRKELPAASARLGLDAGVETHTDAQRTHYFAAIWDAPRVPERGAAGFTAAPDANGKFSARLYLGPKELNSLAAFGEGFTNIVDYGFFGAIAKLMFLFLRGVHAVVGNWGWAILVFTVLLRLALWYPNTKTTLNMLRMKELEPHQKALQSKYEKFGNDMAKKAEMQKELMEFYKKNDHSPFGGCLPMLMQMPVFLSLWSMLNNVFELRHAPWIFWIHDLTAKDPLYILPILMGVSAFVQQATTPAMGDPAQRKMMLVMMPVMMTFMFAQGPAGLALYYLVFNLVSLFQQWWIKRSYVPQPVKV